MQKALLKFLLFFPICDSKEEENETAHQICDSKEEDIVDILLLFIKMITFHINKNIYKEKKLISKLKDFIDEKIKKKPKFYNCHIINYNS